MHFKTDTGGKIPMMVLSRLAIGVWLAASAHASTITLYFTGTSAAGTPNSSAIPAGTSFNGSFTFDPAAPNCGCGDSAHRNFDATAFDFHIGAGLYNATVASPTIEVDHNFGANFG